MMTKSQVVAPSAKKAEIPKRAAAAVAGELATPATEEAKSKGQSVR